MAIFSTLDKTRVVKANDKDAEGVTRWRAPIAQWGFGIRENILSKLPSIVPQSFQTNLAALGIDCGASEHVPNRLNRHDHVVIANEARIDTFRSQVIDLLLFEIPRDPVVSINPATGRLLAIQFVHNTSKRGRWLGFIEIDQSTLTTHALNKPHSSTIAVEAPRRVDPNGAINQDFSDATLGFSRI
jgi:hypothetical protein